MIFIDWLAAAAVRLHYEPKAQVRPPGGQVSQSNGHPLTGQFWGSSWESGEQQPSFVSLRLMVSQMMIHAVTCVCLALLCF